MVISLWYHEPIYAGVRLCESDREKQSVSVWTGRRDACYARIIARNYEQLRRGRERALSLSLSRAVTDRDLTTGHNAILFFCTLTVRC